MLPQIPVSTAETRLSEICISEISISGILISLSTSVHSGLLPIHAKRSDDGRSVNRAARRADRSPRAGVRGRRTRRLRAGQSESGETFAGSRTFPLIALHGRLVAALLVAILGAMTMHSDRSATVAIVVGFVSSTATTGTSRSDRTVRVASRPVNRPSRQRAPRVKRGRGTTAPRR